MGRNAGGMASPIRPFVCQTATDIPFNKNTKYRNERERRRERDREIDREKEKRRSQDLNAIIYVCIYVCGGPKGRASTSKRKEEDQRGQRSVAERLISHRYSLHTGIGEY